MTRILFAWVIRLHPEPFRQHFGEQMMSAFDEAEAEAGGRSMLGDVIVSLVRQRFFRERTRTNAVTASSAPMFGVLETQTLPWRPFFGGALVSLLALALVVAGFSAQISTYIIGSMHPRPSVLGIDPASLTPRDPMTKVTITDPVRDPLMDLGKTYFSVIRVLQAIDRDGDLTLSPSEIRNAAAALASLDLDHDGRLTPEECRQSFGNAAGGTAPDDVAESILRFDANHDGRIQFDELPESLRPLWAAPTKTTTES